MNPKDRMFRAAIAYAEQFRFAVFPCHWIVPGGTCSCGKSDCTSPCKHPLTNRGFKDATLESDVIRKWWGRWPAANIGIATGALSGIIVLDIDPRHGGDLGLEAFEADHGKLPDTPVVLTGGGGYHTISACSRVSQFIIAPVLSVLAWIFAVTAVT